ncbi:hypothetical protein AURDEDRAFT_159973 [Auricularia subglabra TFB-10046 SS5]|nr:hypothetical protein AURDEDRAFT_159973 [Auricularia subglabra TFB-10046 SS5]
MSASDPASWRPVESAYDFWNERSFLAGILIGAVAYGVHATLFFITISLLAKKKRSHWKDYNWLTYVLVLFTISSIANYGQLKFTQMIWIDNRNYPGGPSAYLVEQQTAFEAKLVVGGYMVNGWLQDGLILYRFWVIFGGRPVIILVPSLLFLGTVAILIESAFLYTICGVAFLVPFGLADPFQNVILPTLAQIESIAPLLIIMRVAQGQAWSTETTTQFSRSTYAPKSIKALPRGASSVGDVERGTAGSMELAALRNDSSVDNSTKVDRGAFEADFGGDPVFPVLDVKN